MAALGAQNALAMTEDDGCLKLQTLGLAKWYLTKWDCCAIIMGRANIIRMSYYLMALTVGVPNVNGH
jgi:hypothetical protein